MELDGVSICGGQKICRAMLVVMWISVFTVGFVVEYDFESRIMEYCVSGFHMRYKLHT